MQCDSRVLNGAAVRLTTLEATLSVGSRQTWKLSVSLYLSSHLQMTQQMEHRLRVTGNNHCWLQPHDFAGVLKAATPLAESLLQDCIIH